MTALEVSLCYGIALQNPIFTYYLLKLYFLFSSQLPMWLYHRHICDVFVCFDNTDGKLIENKNNNMRVT